MAAAQAQAFTVAERDLVIAALERTTFFERWASGVPALLNDLGQDRAYVGPRAIDPSSLASVTVPVLVLRGEQTRLSALWGESERHIVRHVPDAIDSRGFRLQAEDQR